MIHGRRSTYQVYACRCDPCRLAEQAYHRRVFQGLVAPRVSPQAARAHVTRLQAAGVGLRRVAALSGVSRTCLERIVNGRYQRITPATEARILAVQQPSLAPGQLVSPEESYRTRERLRRLVEEQYPLPWLRARLGRHAVSLHTLSATREGQRVTVKTWRRVRALHQQLLDWEQAS